MKRTLLPLSFLTVFPALALGSLSVPKADFAPQGMLDPYQRAFALENNVLSWVCPVSEVVEADSESEALNRIGLACIAEVRRSAAKEDDIYGVINVAVSLPNVVVTETEKGYLLQGSFLLKALVFQRSK